MLLTQATAGAPTVSFIQGLQDAKEGGEDDGEGDRRPVGAADDEYKAPLFRMMASCLGPFVDRCVSQQEE
jgi:hypothetical protein